MVNLVQLRTCRRVYRNYPSHRKTSLVIHSSFHLIFDKHIMLVFRELLPILSFLHYLALPASVMLGYFNIATGQSLHSQQTTRIKVC